MKRFSIAVLAAIVLAGTPALAADVPTRIYLDGRPFDKAPGSIAINRGGVVYADVVSLTKAFSGLLTFSGKSVKVLIDSRVGTFTVGSRTLLVGTGSVVMAGAPFNRNGDIYVPLSAFITRIAGAKVTTNKPMTRAYVVVNSGLPTK